MITGPPDAWIERNTDDPDDPYFEGGEPEEEPLFEIEEQHNPGRSENSQNWEQIENLNNRK